MNDDLPDRLVCAFCGLTTDDDPRHLGVHVTFAGHELVQQLGAHFECLRAAVIPDVADTIIDLDAD